MKVIYAVIDTNVLVSALLTENEKSATYRVLAALLNKRVVPLFNNEILSEYIDVLNRPKFSFSKNVVEHYIDGIRELGIWADRAHSNEHFPDPKDAVFYEVALSKDDAYLVTGNTKHFPKKPIVVTPAEMMQILDGDNEQ